MPACASIRCQGIFSSNALKEFIKNELKIEVETKSKVDEWLEQNKTRDYGEVPPELIGPYCCDDVRYTLMLFSSLLPLKEDEMYCHDLYIKNSLHLIQAENTGVQLYLNATKQWFYDVSNKVALNRQLVLSLIGSAGVNPDNDQEFMQYLHSHNMHPAKRQYFNEVKFVADLEFLYSTGHELCKAYADFWTASQLQQRFGVQSGELAFRVKMGAGDQPVLYPNFLQAVFSRGGLTQCKRPNLDEPASLSEFWPLLRPREGHKFIRLTEKNLKHMFFAAGDKELLDTLKLGGDPDAILAARMKQPVAAARALWRQAIEGSGNAVLNRRLKGHCRLDGYAATDLFRKSIQGCSELQGRFEATMKAEGCLIDVMGRKIKVEPNKMYRAIPIWLNSCHGSILTYYLDLLARLAVQYRGRLALAHESNFLIEVPDSSVNEFTLACRELLVRPLLKPIPAWEISA